MSTQTLTNKEKLEIRMAIEAQAAQFADFASLVWKTLKLDEDEENGTS